MVVIVHDFLADADGEQTHEQSPILVVRDTPPVIALANQVLQGVHGNLVIIIQEHLTQKVK